MPYNIPVLKEIASLGLDILCIHNDLNKLTPYVPEPIKGIVYYKKSQITKSELFRISYQFNADLVYISDRTIWEYNKIGVYYKRKHIPVVSGNDTQWKSGKQWVNVLTSFFRHKRYFSHMQVAGIRQFEYAKKLGFANRQIIWPMYSADINVFEQLPLTLKRFADSTDYLFVGRFNKVKGINYLVDAWKSLDMGIAKLHLVGNGPLLVNIQLPDSIVLHSFSNQNYLIELAMKCKAFILPSIEEPWGVVIHEFSAAGMPLITTDVCGASAHFLINNANGYLVKPGCSKSLADRIMKIQNTSSEKLLQMGTISRKLSRSINPQHVAQALLSVVNE